MKQKAMETKLVVRPLVGCLTHTHFWEGPCRAGRREDMTAVSYTHLEIDRRCGIIVCSFK